MQEASYKHLSSNKTPLNLLLKSESINSNPFSIIKTRLIVMFKSKENNKIAALMVLVSACFPLYAMANTMEGQSMSLMETAVTRHSGPASYESPVDFNRNNHFNSSQTLQPGWNLNATAIGNLVNVQMSGAGNTVTVNAMQINHGNQTAVISLYGGSVQSASNSKSEVKQTSANYTSTISTK